MIPVRCFTCGKVIANAWELFVKMVNEGISIQKALDDLKIKRYCCRRMFMGTVDNFNEIAKYKDKK